MKHYKQLQDEIAKLWRNSKGRSAVVINKKINPQGIIFHVIECIREMTDRTICVITDSYYNFTKYSNIFNLEYEHYHTDVISNKYAKNMKLKYDVIITLNITDIDIINKYNNECKFYLHIYTENVDKSLRDLITFIHPRININDIIEDYINSPVKETLIGVDMSAKDSQDYEKANGYVIESMRIFGDLDTVNKCRMGDKVKNISPISYCNIVAHDNGWNEYIDTSTDFGKELDSFYNPNSLHDRAINVYNIIRLRRDICTKNKAKFKDILDIIRDNHMSKILVVFTNGEYAYEFTQYAKEYDINIGNYHDCIPDTIQTKDNGEVVLVKTGANKGEPKIIGSRKQSTIAEKNYNDDKIRVLAIKSSSDSSLSIDVDIVIFASPFVGNIKDIRRRFQNILFLNNPTEIYTFYCINTIEEKEVDKLESTPIHEIIRNDKNIFISD